MTTLRLVATSAKIYLRFRCLSSGACFQKMK
jgi:hypothetical protein